MHLFSNRVIGAWWILFLAVWGVGALGAKPAVQRQSLASELSHRIFLILAVVCLFLRFPAIALWRPVLESGRAGVTAGEVVAALGIAFAFWARATLGSNWSGTVTFKEDHELIQRGPYALARHPIYTGLLLGFIGTALAAGTPAGWVGVVLAIVAFKRKSLIEERVMIEHFGDRYASYARQVRALIPYIW